MPIPSLGAITGDDLQSLIDSLEKQRKELEWLLRSLDSTNVKELTADVINAGVIKGKHIEIGSETTYQTGYSPNDLRIEMETKFSVIDGEISLRVKQTDFNLLGNRVATAESSISVLPGQISSKVSYTDYTGSTIASLINQSASHVTISASHIELEGIVRVSDSLDLGHTGNGRTKAIRFNGNNAWIYTSGDFQLTLDASFVRVLGDLTARSPRFGGNMPVITGTSVNQALSIGLTPGGILTVYRPDGSQSTFSPN